MQRNDRAYPSLKPDPPPVPAATIAQSSLTGIERAAQEDAGHAYATDSDEDWRDEVTSRVNSYRAKRRRGAPEGAMNLAFEEPQLSPARAEALERVAARFAARPSSDVLLQSSQVVTAPEEAAAAEVAEPTASAAPAVTDPNDRGKLIEFPRAVATSHLLPPPLLEELAEAMPETPRILEAPEPEPVAAVPPVMPTVAAITLDAGPVAQAPEAQRSLPAPLQVAALGQRLLAGLLDLLVVVVAFGVFSFVAVRTAGVMPQSRLVPGFAFLIAASLWAFYQYLFLGNAGQTPGMAYAHLEVRDFAGRPLAMGARRIRALAMLVSAMPLCLGFVWSLLDEDMLCWHDRITHSCVVEQQEKTQA